jgi:hypothetical protein
LCGYTVSIIQKLSFSSLKDRVERGAEIMKRDKTEAKRR